MYKATVMDYPTHREVMNASHEQLARWYRFLHTPGHLYPGRVEEERSIMELIMYRLHQHGGITPELSKAIGWNKDAKAFLCTQ